MSTIDLTGTYTYTYTEDFGYEPREVIVRTKVRTRTTADGEAITTVSGLAPLFADTINAITDEGAQLHTLTVLGSASLSFSDVGGDFFSHMVTTRENGRVRTAYAGTPELPVGVVLDLGIRLRNQLRAESIAPALEAVPDTLAGLNAIMLPLRHELAALRGDVERALTDSDAGERIEAKADAQATMALMAEVLGKMQQFARRQGEEDYVKGGRAVADGDPKAAERAGIWGAFADDLDDVQDDLARRARVLNELTEPASRPRRRATDEQAPYPRGDRAAAERRAGSTAPVGRPSASSARRGTGEGRRVTHP